MGFRCLHVLFVCTLEPCVFFFWVTCVYVHLCVLMVSLVTLKLNQTQEKELKLFSKFCCFGREQPASLLGSVFLIIDTNVGSGKSCHHIMSSNKKSRS